MKFFTCLMLICLALTGAHAHTTFSATLEGTEGNVTFSGYTHSGNFFYNLTSDIAGVESAKLVIGEDPAVPLENPAAPNSTDFLAAIEDYTPDPPALAYFTPEDIVIALPEVYGGIYDLFQQACSGDLLLVVETADATLSGTVNYVPPETANGVVKTCEQATKPYVPAQVPAPAPAPSSSAAKASVLLGTAAAVLAAIAL